MSDLLLLLSLAVTEFWMEATKASFSCSLGMDPANSPNRHSKRDCKDPPEKEFCIPTLDNFWAKISYFETTSLASLLCKESLCNWFFWPRNCVNGSNKTFKMYAQYGTTSLPLHGYRNRHRSRFSKKKIMPVGTHHNHDACERRKFLHNFRAKLWKCIRTLVCRDALMTVLKYKHLCSITGVWGAFPRIEEFKRGS